MRSSHKHESIVCFLCLMQYTGGKWVALALRVCLSIAMIVSLCACFICRTEVDFGGRGRDSQSFQRDQTSQRIGRNAS